MTTLTLPPGINADNVGVRWGQIGGETFRRLDAEWGIPSRVTMDTTEHGQKPGLPAEQASQYDPEADKDYRRNHLEGLDMGLNITMPLATAGIVRDADGNLARDADGKLIGGTFERPKYPMGHPDILPAHRRAAQGLAIAVANGSLRFVDVRIAHEHNGAWPPWGTDQPHQWRYSDADRDAIFVENYRASAEAFLEHGLGVDWNCMLSKWDPGEERERSIARFPGRPYVTCAGFDPYFRSPDLNQKTTEEWAERTDSFLEFLAGHQIPLSIPEWAIGPNFGDRHRELVFDVFLPKIHAYPYGIRNLIYFSPKKAGENPFQNGQEVVGYHDLSIERGGDPVRTEELRAELQAYINGERDPAPTPDPPIVIPPTPDPEPEPPVVDPAPRYQVTGTVGELPVDLTITEIV